MSFGPPSEYDETSPLPVVSHQAAPSMRFHASSRHQHLGSARHDGFHAIAAFRPQVFSTSRRFAPRCTLRACFIPLARPGFALQGFSLTRSRLDSSPKPCPLVVTASDPPLARRRRPKLRFRALLPWRVRCVRFTVKQSDRPIPSWAFPSPRLASLRSWIAFLRSSPHELAAPHVRDVRCSAPQGLPEPKDGTLSRERASLLEVRGLVVNFAVRNRARTGLIVSPREGCCVTAAPPLSSLVRR